MQTLEHNAREQLLVILENKFERCFHYWQEYWNKSMCAEGSHPEGQLPYILVSSVLVFTDSVLKPCGQTSYLLSPRI
jgi:hypothetical protein